MKYQTPQFQPAGVASELIQFKASPKADMDNNFMPGVMSTLLERE